MVAKRSSPKFLVRGCQQLFLALAFLLCLTLPGKKYIGSIVLQEPKNGMQNILNIVKKDPDRARLNS